MTAFTATVHGTPAPQGSKRALGRRRNGSTILVESSAALPAWRAALRDQLSAYVGTYFGGWRPLDGPLAAVLTFRVPRPRSHYRTGRNAHLLRADAPLRPATRPDVDKFARAVLDGLTDAQVIVDDCRVVDLRAVKFYADDHHTPGVDITVAPAVGTTT